MPAGPEADPRTPAIGLDAALVELLAVTRAQSVRLIDLGGGRLLAARATHPVPVDPAADLALARLAEASSTAAAPDGGLDDLVLTGRGGIHVLAPAPYGSVLVVRLGHGADVGITRRALGSPRLAAALLAGHPAAPDIGVAVPRPRRSGRGVGDDTGPMRVLRVVPAPPAPGPGEPGEQQPALAALVVRPFAERTGELAARALGDVAAVVPGDPADPVVHVPLPRRSGGAALFDEAVLATEWSRDVEVMRRVLDGLRRRA